MASIKEQVCNYCNDGRLSKRNTLISGNTRYQCYTCNSCGKETRFALGLVSK